MIPPGKSSENMDITRMHSVFKKHAQKEIVRSDLFESLHALIMFLKMICIKT